MSCLLLWSTSLAWGVDFFLLNVAFFLDRASLSFFIHPPLHSQISQPDSLGLLLIAAFWKALHVKTKPSKVRVSHAYGHTNRPTVMRELSSAVRSIHPPFLHFVYSIIITFLESHLCCPYTHRYSAIHWSVEIYRARPWKKTDCPSSRRHHLSIAPQLGVEVHDPFDTMPKCWLAPSYSGLLGNHNCSWMQ